jgi:hypothetical protein
MEFTNCSCKGLPIKSNWNLIWLKEKFSPVATAYLDFIQTEKKELLGPFKWIKDKIEVVQNNTRYFLFCILY